VEAEVNQDYAKIILEDVRYYLPLSIGVPLGLGLGIGANLGRVDSLPEYQTRYLDNKIQQLF